MQYLEGETLDARLKKKSALPLDQALQYAIQIADALATAHKAGIVHRDLKPGNIMLTKVGAKLLDFGLAKTGASVLSGANLSMLPTTPPITQQSTILGTFQYMAPEQLEGREADARTDIFAFGAVVYEMFTGKKAFEGKSQASLIGAIMHAEPPPISVIQPSTPALLDDVVKGCLAKDPEARWQSASDLMHVLKWVADTGLGAAAASGAAPAARPTRRERVVWVSALAAAIAATIALGTVSLGRVSGTGAPPMRFAVVPPQNVTFSAENGASIPAVSPDGHRLAFVATRAGATLLWVRSLDVLEAQPLSGTEGAAFPFWSPDSRTLGFFVFGATLKTIDASGGPVRTLCDVPARVSFARGGTWNPDGVIVFGSQSGGLFTVSANGGTPTALTTPDTSRGESGHRFPSFLPDGRHVVYWASPSNTILLGSLDSKETTRLLTAESQAVSVVPGLLLFARRGTIVAQPLDARHATLTGEVVPIAEQVLPDSTGAAAFAASSNGVLVVRTGTLSGKAQLTWVDRHGRSLGAVGPPDRYRNPVLSPDGTRLAVEATDAQARTQHILMGLARGVPSRFTFDPGNDIFPVWSHDGRLILFASDRSGTLELYQKRADGVGTEDQVFKNLVGS